MPEMVGLVPEKNEKSSGSEFWPSGSGRTPVEPDHLRDLRHLRHLRKPAHAPAPRELAELSSLMARGVLRACEKARPAAISCRTGRPESLDVSAVSRPHVGVAAKNPGTK
jgi:hypothetical protein